MADWMLSREVRVKGDWSVKRPKTEPSGWAFLFRNDCYPDIDDTAMILLALSRARAADAAGPEGLPSARARLDSGYAGRRWRLGCLRRR